MSDEWSKKYAIEMHFQEALKLSEQIAEMAVVLRTLGNETFPCVIAKTKTAWQGNAADILTGKEVRLIVLITAQAQKLNMLAIELKNKAERMYQAELNNLLMAETRH